MIRISYGLRHFINDMPGMKQITFAILLFIIAAFTSCQKDGIIPSAKQTSSNTKVAAAFKTLNKYAINTAVTGFIRVVLAKDSINKDDILITFNPNTSPAFVFNEDARYFQGYGMVSFSSLSSDGVPLSINKLPFPATTASITLNVNATASATYKLNLTAVNSIPANYDIWLMDSYNKDSCDFRHNPTYAFNLNKADTNSYGSNRFRLVIRKNASLNVHLLDFQADKVEGGATFNWKTENEGNTTTFVIEKSGDKGKTFAQLTSIISSGAGTYSFFEEIHSYGENQYRLKVISMDGSVLYSKVISSVNFNDYHHYSHNKPYAAKHSLYHNG